MPQLVRTPEDVLRSTKRDLYVIRHQDWFADEGTVGKINGEIKRWFAKNLPETELEILGPSERSGFLAGGVGRLMRVDFTPAALNRFVAEWETEDGSSKDNRWSCVMVSYAAFAKRDIGGSAGVANLNDL